ncbi:MAG: dienelactone hydrolase family protein [Brevundimonas sp.]|uniref:dienelactone hydrolase family protein n=1 Tax=Brevundimonas sp. TaxID=1871086 RepID=UPI002486D605|nr:alpha/beta family hydrolase [Brevundimonas sp.]MDI1327717.1 dienelactone hydrolase family protein [Brevundimonas sp.]
MTDSRAITPVEIPPVGLAGELRAAERARGIVIFAHGSGSSRLSPRNRQVARALSDAGLATLLFDLLTEAEAADRTNVFDIDLLARRLVDAIDWVSGQPALAALPIGLFGASTGAAAALKAAAARPEAVKAVVSRGGRPDLAGEALLRVAAPTLLIVGGNDEPVLGWNRDAAVRMRGAARVMVIPGATHLFEEPGAMERVTSAATDWFAEHL